MRSAAAEAMGNLGPAREKLGPALLAHVAKEKVRFVLDRVLRAIGEMHYEVAVPDLVKMLDVHSLRRVREAMMYALYRITGHKFLTREKWRGWFEKDYPLWKERTRR